jgi:hypothetical protein
MFESEDKSLNNFIQLILPLMILFIGLAGNLAGFGLFMYGKKLKKLSVRNMYIYLFSIDSIYLMSLLVDYFEMGFRYVITAYSELTCKLNIFFRYSFANISPMILVYISMERFVAIKYPGKRFKLRKNKTQFFYLLFISGINLILYTPFAFMIKHVHLTDQDLNDLDGITKRNICSFGDESKLDSVLAYLDLINRVVLPFILMLVSSILLIVCIFKSRQRVLKNYTNLENKIFKRDVRLAFTSLILNCFYVTLNLPLSFNELFEVHDVHYAFSVYMFYASYGVNFYLVFISNFLFRKELFYCLNKARKNQPAKRVVNQIRYHKASTRKGSNEIVKFSQNKIQYRTKSSYF